MTDAAQDGDLLARVAAFMAAARAIGSTSDEVKLVCERIATEFKAVRQEMGDGPSKDLESRVTALENRQLLIINGLAQLANQTPPFSGTITFTVSPADATVTWTKADGTTATGASITVPIGQNVSYSVNKSGYSRASGTIFVDSSEITRSITLEVARQIDYSFSGAFADQDGLLAHLIDGTNFVRTTNAFYNGSKSYNVNRGSSQGYITFTTPGTETTLRVTAAVSSEASYDYGGVYVGTARFQPTQSQAKAKTTDGKGSYLMSIAGSVASKAYAMTLQPNTTYYLNFFYVKDISNNIGEDRFTVTAISFSTAA